MPVPSPKDLKREADLYARVVAAREAYNEAKVEAAALEMIRTDLGLDHPDGRASARKAAQLEGHALEAYGEALREFTAFVLANRGDKPATQK